MNAWIESVRFACEVQGVISMRLICFAQGGPEADAEARLMVSEKMAAFADAEVALANSLFAGENIMVAAERAYAPLRRCAAACTPTAAASHTRDGVTRRGGVSAA
jgi:hypothetical protein